MPIFMDVHENLGDVTEEDIKSAHKQDLAIQDQYGVQPAHSGTYVRLVGCHGPHIMPVMGG